MLVHHHLLIIKSIPQTQNYLMLEYGDLSVSGCTKKYNNSNTFSGYTHLYKW